MAAQRRVAVTLSRDTETHNARSGRQRPRSTVAALFDPRDNALNTLRLAFAILVIISHSWPVGGFGPDYQVGDLTLGSIAVGGFFTISGFLITRSRLSTSLGTYAWRRAIRIMPGYWVCLVVVAFGAAPIAAAAREGWSLSAAVSYVLRQALLYRAGTATVGGTLAGAPYPTAWNSPLWTLFFEAACYGLVGVAAYSSWFRHRPWVTLVAFAGSTAASWMTYAHAVPGTVGLLATFLPWFLAGAVLLQYSDRISLRWPYALLAAVLLAASLWGRVGHVIAALPLAYLCLWLAVVAPGWLRRCCARTDISYGTYLYAFPVQQLLVVAHVHDAGLGVYVLACVAATIPVAVASWFLVERPALRWKSPPRWLVRQL